MKERTDTIAAIATAAGQAGIGIVRISGEHAIEVGDAVVRKAGGDSLRLTQADTHTIHYGFVFDGEEMIDEVLVSVMRSPRSYTTEDTVEINCHGGTYLLRRVLSAVLKHGARPAEPGEFTKRAFLNGRIDLTEAESVMDLISSGNEFARQNSLKTLRGSVYRKIREIRDKILRECAWIEAALDDPEHYSLEGYPPELMEKLDRLLDEIKILLLNSGNGRKLREGIRICIAGRPNVGKSTLFNLLAGEERAIVTEIPGTTRDAVDTEIHSGSISLIVTDTAGLRETDDTVERIGVRKTRERMAEADLVLLVLDASRPLEEEDLELFPLLKEKKHILILNKQDLLSSGIEGMGHFLSGISSEEQESLRKLSDAPIVCLSAKYDEDTRELEDVIRRQFLSGEVSMNDQVFITSERQLSALKRAEKSLELVMDSIRAGVSEDFYTVDLMDAYGSLGEIIGEETGEDLADRIFSEFCMGK